MGNAPQRHFKHVSEVRNVAIDMRGKLDVGELLLDPPVITEEVTSDLSFSSAAVNTTALTINGRVVAIGKAVQFTVSGGVAEEEYSIRVQVNTDSTPAQTLIENIDLDVIED